MNRTLANQAAPADFGPLPAGRLLQRQCACGTHTGGATCESCAGKTRGLQRKLSIGAANDPLEHEADRVADQVLALPSAAAIASAPVRIQRLGPQGAAASDAVPASVDQTLRGGGRPLDGATRTDMEQRFGHDFSQVRVHDDGAAQQSARDVNARAYTVGNAIVFGAGEYAPRSAAGRHLLAHELTHTIQQGPPVLHAKPLDTGRSRDADEARRSARAEVHRYDEADEADEVEVTDEVEDLAEAFGFARKDGPVRVDGSAAAKVRPNPDTGPKDPREKVSAQLDAWQQAFFKAVNRFQGWLLLNLSEYQHDYLLSEKGDPEVQRIMGGVGEMITEAALSQMGSTAIEGLGKKIAIATMSAAVLASKFVKTLGGLFNFAVGLIMDAVVEHIADKTGKLIDYVMRSNAILNLQITSSVDKCRDKALADIQQIRSRILFGKISLAEMKSFGNGFDNSAVNLEQQFTDLGDLSLYHKMALSHGVFDKRYTAPADKKPLENIDGQGEKIVFSMAHDHVGRGPERTVPYDGSIVTIGIRSYDCEGWDYVDINNPNHVNTALPKPPRYYYVKLKGGGSANEFPDRTFTVGVKEYGTWYNVPKGTYQIEIDRYAGGHPVGLCGFGEMKIMKAGAR